MPQTFEEYQKKKTEALKEFQDFLEECEKKDFTVQQLLMIGEFANQEIKKIVAEMQANTKFSASQSDPLRYNRE